MRSKNVRAFCHCVSSVTVVLWQKVNLTNNHLIFQNKIGVILCENNWRLIWHIIQHMALASSYWITKNKGYGFYWPTLYLKISISPAICCYTTSWNSKIQKCYWFWQHIQQTVDMFLRTLWTLDLTSDSSQTDCLRTADIDWLTNILKFVRWHLKSTVESCCIMVIFFTMIIFALYSFFLRYTSCIVHIFE